VVHSSTWRPSNHAGSDGLLLPITPTATLLDVCALVTAESAHRVAIYTHLDGDTDSITDLVSQLDLIRFIYEQVNTRRDEVDCEAQTLGTGDPLTICETAPAISAFSAMHKYSTLGFGVMKSKCRLFDTAPTMMT
jgi:hypothetical protein